MTVQCAAIIQVINTAMKSLGSCVKEEFMASPRRSSATCTTGEHPEVAITTNKTADDTYLAWTYVYIYC